MSSKGIFRLSRRKRFAQIDTEGLEDQRLSFKAKGVWTYLMSRTDDWTTRVQHLSTVSRDGEKAVRSALDELIKHGYALRRQRRGSDGTYKPVEWWILEAPPEVLRERMPDEEYEAFLEEWKTWPDPNRDDDKEAAKEKKDEKSESPEPPDPQNGEAVQKAPDPGNGEAVKSPDPQNGEAVDSPDPQNRKAVEKPDRHFRDAGQRHAENRGLLKNESTYETETTYDGSGQSVGKSRTLEASKAKSTDGLTNRPPADSETDAYIDWVALYWGLDWTQELREDISELFEPWDGPAGRAWLEQKMERLAERYSAIGVADMVRKDIRAGECPEPVRRQQENRSHSSSGEQQSLNVGNDNTSQSNTKTLVLEDFSDSWGRALLELREKVSRDNFNAWFRKIDCGGRRPNSDEFVLLVEDDFFKVWIEDNYVDLIEESVAEVVGRAVEVELMVRGKVEVECTER